MIYKAEVIGHTCFHHIDDKQTSDIQSDRIKRQILPELKTDSRIICTCLMPCCLPSEQSPIKSTLHIFSRTRGYNIKCKLSNCFAWKGRKDTSHVLLGRGVVCAIFNLSNENFKLSKVSKQ